MNHSQTTGEALILVSLFVFACVAIELITRDEDLRQAGSQQTFAPLDGWKWMIPLEQPMTILSGWW